MIGYTLSKEFYLYTGLSNTLQRNIQHFSFCIITNLPHQSTSNSILPTLKKVKWQVFQLRNVWCRYFICYVHKRNLHLTAAENIHHPQAKQQRDYNRLHQANQKREEWDGFKFSGKRSSRSEVFYNKSILKNFANFTGKHLCQSLFFNKKKDLRPANLLKKRLWHRYFPVNFGIFLRTPFFTEHLQTTASEEKEDVCDKKPR